MINKLAKEIHANNREKGFYENKKNTGEMLCLIHSEVSEALEADRNELYCNIHEPYDTSGNTTYQDIQHEDWVQFKWFFETDIKNTFEDELADIMIRVMDLSEHKGIDLEAHIKAKMRYNSLREYKHGKKF